jgi:itaconate CoA-transferase
MEFLSPLAGRLLLRSSRQCSTRVLRRHDFLRSSSPLPAIPISSRRLISTSTSNPAQPLAFSPAQPIPSTATPSTLPLAGLTVVTLEQAIAAPFCTRQLADLGARVIKVERPGGGDFARDYDTRVNGLSSHFTWVNRSKESLALDLKNPSDLEVLKKLIATKVDVVVQNLAPGASERLGLGYEKLKELRPGVIVCDISGYGSDGPYRDKKAYDLLVQSEAGFLSVTGTGKDQPAKAGCSIADIAAGMYAYSNVLSALIQRQKTGKGCRIDISMLESMVEWMSFPMYYAYGGAEPPVPVGASHASIYPYGPFMAGDGTSVMLGIQNEREWVNFCEVALENPGLATDPRFDGSAKRSDNRDELRRIIEEVFSRHSAEEVVARLDRAKVANAKVNDMAGVWDHPQLKARKRWTEFDSPVGPLPALLPPGMPKEFGDARMDPIPTVGQHNEAILEELRAEGRS